MDTAGSANPKIILVGSPNVGKSVIFGLLTGRYATVSNYPGTTVEVSRGHMKIGGKSCEVIDTPGLYSIYPVTEEERVTLGIIKKESHSVIVHVIDAKNLERSLPLTFQLQMTNRPVILALNMYDELTLMGAAIDISALSEKLNLPIAATVAVNNQGTGRLVDQIKTALTGAATAWPPTAEEFPPYTDRMMKSWYTKASEIAIGVTRKTEKQKGLSRLDKLLTSPVSGFLILAAVLYVGLYKIVGSLGAGTFVGFLENAYQHRITPWLTEIVYTYAKWPWLRDLFAGEYGILTLGVRYALCIILPIVGLFFLVFAVIEDSGYLPRLAYLLDSIFKRIGLSGRAVIPMVLGLGCDTMATMVVRTLATKRERIIATLLLSLTIPCSAQMGVILGLLAGRPKILALWAIIIAAIFGLTGTMLAKIMPGTRPTFIIEVPPMRLPKLKNILVKTYVRMVWYFKEIVPLFIIASILIWLGRLTGVFETVVGFLAKPLSYMGLPEPTAPVFLFGFFRRDYGAAGLYDLARTNVLSGNQILISVVVLTLFLPCIAQLLITIKERGWKIAAAISTFILVFAFAAGFVLNSALRLFDINL